MAITNYSSTTLPVKVHVDAVVSCFFGATLKLADHHTTVQVLEPTLEYETLLLSWLWKTEWIAVCTFVYWRVLLFYVWQMVAVQL